jgi:hypothetical protein
MKRLANNSVSEEATAASSVPAAPAPSKHPARSVPPGAFRAAGQMLRETALVHPQVEGVLVAIACLPADAETRAPDQDRRR